MNLEATVVKLARKAKKKFDEVVIDYTPNADTLQPNTTKTALAFAACAASAVLGAGFLITAGAGGYGLVKAYHSIQDYRELKNEKTYTE